MKDFPAGSVILIHTPYLILTSTPRRRHSNQQTPRFSRIELKAHLEVKKPQKYKTALADTGVYVPNIVWRYVGMNQGPYNY